MLYAIEEQRRIASRRGQSLAASSPQSVTLLRQLTARKTVPQISTSHQMGVTTELISGAHHSVNIASAETLSLSKKLTKTIRPTGTANTVTLAQTPNFTTAFSATLSVSASSAANFSFRQLISPISASGTQVRVTFKAGPSGIGYIADNVSIGTQTTTYNTSATPVELLFGGISGLSVPPNATIVSDWLTFTVSSGTNVVVILDSSNNASMFTLAASSGVASCTTYSLAATNSYNVASPAGSWTTQTGVCVEVSKIEVK